MSQQIELLREAAALFRFYEQSHRAKGAGHEEKVARNADIAGRIEACLAERTRPAAPVAQCACCPEGLLDSFTGGAAPEGLFGRVTLLINGQRVDYVPVPAALVAAVQAYGDSRADDDGKSVERIAECVTLLRAWGASLLAVTPAAPVAHDPDPMPGWIASLPTERAPAAPVTQPGWCPGCTPDECQGCGVVNLPEGCDKELK